MNSKINIDSKYYTEINPGEKLEVSGLDQKKVFMPYIMVETITYSLDYYEKIGKIIELEQALEKLK